MRRGRSQRAHSLPSPNRPVHQQRGTVAQQVRKARGSPGPSSRRRPLFLPIHRANRSALRSGVCLRPHPRVPRRAGGSREDGDGVGNRAASVFTVEPCSQGDGRRRAGAGCFTVFPGFGKQSGNVQHDGGVPGIRCQGCRCPREKIPARGGRRLPAHHRDASRRPRERSGPAAPPVWRLGQVQGRAVVGEGGRQSLTGTTDPDVASTCGYRTASRCPGACTALSARVTIRSSTSSKGALLTNSDAAPSRIRSRCSADERPAGPVRHR